MEELHEGFADGMKPVEFGLKRIVFPLEGFGVNGGVRIIISVANTLAEYGHRVRIIVPDYASVPPFPLRQSVELQVVQTCGSPLLRKVWYLVKLCLISARGTHTRLGFVCERSLGQGIREIADMVRKSSIKDFSGEMFNNHAMVRIYARNGHSEHSSIRLLEALARGD